MNPNRNREDFVFNTIRYFIESDFTNDNATRLMVETLCKLDAIFESIEEDEFN